MKIDEADILPLGWTSADVHALSMHPGDAEVGSLAEVALRVLAQAEIPAILLCGRLSSGSGEARTDHAHACELLTKRLLASGHHVFHHLFFLPVFGRIRTRCGDEVFVPLITEGFYRQILASPYICEVRCLPEWEGSRVARGIHALAEHFKRPLRYLADVDLVSPF